MKHRVSGRKLGRPSDHKKAMLRNLVTSLIINDRIVTTVTRAKELRRLADRMITLGKKSDLASRRRAMRVLTSRTALDKLFRELAPRYTNRNGGYTRFVRYSNRKGDGATTVIMEWVE